MDIRRLGMSETQEEIFGRMLKAPFGIILVTGPTGSGKSTLIQHFNALIRPTSGTITTMERISGERNMTDVPCEAR
mgnify:CR=1 FL=1